MVNPSLGVQEVRWDLGGTEQAGEQDIDGKARRKETTGKTKT
jgi:hypothetical protein